MLKLVIKNTWDGRPIPLEEQVTLELSAADRNRLQIVVRAPFHGDPPPAGAPGPTIGLWEHEVVELFVLGASQEDDPDAPPVYTELELGPHGHQLVLRLRGVRQVVGRLLPLEYETRIDATGVLDAWCGVALLDRALLPPPPHRINAYAIHGTGDKRRYLALYPGPGEGPDFHRLECFEEVSLPDA